MRKKDRERESESIGRRSATQSRTFRMIGIVRGLGGVLFDCIFKWGGHYSYDREYIDYWGDQRTEGETTIATAFQDM